MGTKSLKEKAIKIKGKDYVQVKDRIVYLSEEVQDYSIDTDYQYFPDHKMWVVKAKLTTPKGTYTGLAQEIESDNYKEVNYSSALENAETSAVGRACAMAGIGVLDSIASIDEINKATNRQPQQPQELVKPGHCNVCGETAVKAKSGNWYCPAYKAHKENGESWKIVADKKPLTPNEQKFMESLCEK